MPENKVPQGKYAWTATVGEKGQIVIPKEVRDMFGLSAGDQLVLLADTKRGIALQTPEKLTPMLKKAFDGLPCEEESEE